ncbi:MAG: UDP-N-acetylglucosamine 2-epimerase (non-hydrolyzing) [Bacteroidales bacterium]
MLKILTVIGARPQIIKAAALSRAIRTHFHDSLREIILHTGQHYDNNMSGVFFHELGIPEPDHNLNVGSGTHGKQTAAMIAGIEDALIHEKPDYLILYGDTNSTLAGAVAGAKLHIPVVHIEAGLRSFNKYMPEEINRITCDHASTLLFSPTMTGFNNLKREGFRADTAPPHTIDNPKIYHCGDIMYDNSLYFAGIARERSGILEKYELEPGKFILGTIHRDNNTDNPQRLTSIFRGIIRIAEESRLPVILPLHPRTSGVLTGHTGNDTYDALTKHALIRITEPVPFLDMIMLEKNAKMIMTDSGGVQKEAYFFRKPCIILRRETEWKEIVEQGAGILTDADENKIIHAFRELSTRSEETTFPPIFGDGRAAEFICTELIRNKT